MLERLQKLGSLEGLMSCLVRGIDHWNGMTISVISLFGRGSIPWNNYFNRNNYSLTKRNTYSSKK
jgi:hypothetical protein